MPNPPYIEPDMGNMIKHYQELNRNSVDHHPQQQSILLKIKKTRTRKRNIV